MGYGFIYPKTTKNRGGLGGAQAKPKTPKLTPRGYTMLYAVGPDGEKQKATPKARGSCPSCGEELVARCGDINIWHWAHKSLRDCDPWYEPESRWHLLWKSQVDPVSSEVVIGEHRADIFTGKVVIELQHSPLSPEEIRKREEFYQILIWLFDVRDCADNIELRNKGDYYTFRWRWPRKHIWHATKPVYLDLGFQGVFQVKKIHHDVPCGGWGYLLTAQEFLDRFLL